MRLSCHRAAQKRCSILRRTLRILVDIQSVMEMMILMMSDILLRGKLMFIRACARPVAHVIREENDDDVEII